MATPWGVRSRMSFRLENLAGIVWPNEPIGPDGGSSPAAGNGKLVDVEAACSPAFEALEFGALPPVVSPGVPPIAFCDSCFVFGPPKVCVSERGTLGALPDDGCFEIGSRSARRDSSGVGMLMISSDCDGAWCVTPGLSCPVPALKLGSVGTVALSSAPANPLMPDQARAVVSMVASLKLREFFMRSLQRLCGNNGRWLQGLH
jgi:hypothetical protein